MKVKVCAICQECNKADASILAVCAGAPHTEKYTWHLCATCFAKVKGWEKVGDYAPTIKQV